LNRIGSAVVDVTKLNRSLNTTFKFASQFDKLNSTYNVAKGVGAMTNKFTEMSGTSALPKITNKVAIQSGNQFN
jgi:hypothetical protein